MSLRERIQDALSEQINEELFSAYLYLSMAIYFHGLSLNGFAHWMEKQSEEDIGHAMRLYRFVLGRNGTVKLRGVEQPLLRWESPAHVFEDALKHELKITDRISRLYEMASGEKDYATVVELQYFITEQSEEESSVRSVLERLRMAGTSSQGLVFIDGEMSRR
jgi:ferritin